MHMPLHRQVRGDGFPTHNHRRQLQFEVGDFLNQGALVVKHKECRKTRNLGNPSDILETRPLGNLHRMVYYVLRAASPLSEVQSMPKLSEIQALPQCLPGRVHAPESTSSYNSSALAG